ncbi:serine hydrolase [Enterococcus faecalis]|nr:serine hydrolase [Enterococcus faecalis]
MGFFFSSRGEDYAKESEQKVTIDSAKHEKHTKDKEENNSANTVFFDKINDLLVASVKEFEGTVGISYLDLETGEQRSVNGQHEFYTASTIKVPLTMLVADTVASGQKKWTDLIPYNAEEDYEEGTGIIAYNIQPEYPLKTLQEYAITFIHDMGILETPHPFALAIFTKGPDNAKSAAFIASVTDKLWQLQVSEYPNDNH